LVARGAEIAGLGGAGVDGTGGVEVVVEGGFAGGSGCAGAGSVRVVGPVGVAVVTGLPLWGSSSGRESCARSQAATEHNPMTRNDRVPFIWTWNARGH